MTFYEIEPKCKFIMPDARGDIWVLFQGEVAYFGNDPIEIRLKINNSIQDQILALTLPCFATFAQLITNSTTRHCEFTIVSNNPTVTLVGSHNFFVRKVS